MTKTIGSDFFGLWQETQNHLWKNLSAVPESFRYPNEFNLWRQPNFQSFSAWGESAIKQSFELQSRWLDQWVERIKVEAGDHDVFLKLMDQMNESMKRWTQTQTELWEQWFGVLDASVNIPGVTQSHMQNLNTWKSAVKQCFSEQTGWLSSWREQIDYKSLRSKELEEFAIQLKDSLDGWIQNQEQLWEFWFEFVNSGETQPKTSVKRATPSKPDVTKAATSRDDLKKISGIGPALEKKLNNQGIITYQQIADLNDGEIERMEQETLGFPGRIGRENWVGQAKELCAGRKA